MSNYPFRSICLAASALGRFPKGIPIKGFDEAVDMLLNEDILVEFNGKYVVNNPQADLLHEIYKQLKLIYYSAPKSYGEFIEKLLKDDSKLLELMRRLGRLEKDWETHDEEDFL